MDKAQIAGFVQLLAALAPDAFHFGDCVGADAAAFALVRAHLPTCWTVAHPPLNSILRAWCEADAVLEPEPYAVRNEAIVEACHQLAVAPLERFSTWGSGTWQTIRMARRREKPVHMLLRA